MLLFTTYYRKLKKGFIEFVNKYRKDKKNMCWQAIPCKYDNYNREPDDEYNGDIFGRLTDFESPHFLYRRFHSNYCKALVISILSNYRLKDDDDRLISQISEISLKFELHIIARHNSLILMIGAIEVFLRDSFKTILENIYPEKIERSEERSEEMSVERTIKRYSFQNLNSTIKAFSWLCPEFKKDEIFIDRHPSDFYELINVYDSLEEMLHRRHKIVHESHYYLDLDAKRLSDYACLCLSWADRFDDFFEDNDYYSRIETKLNKY